MNNEEISKIITNIKLKTLFSGGDELWEQALSVIKHFQAENAELRARMEKAIELPQKIYNKVKEINCKSDNANRGYVFQTELGIDHVRQERLLKEFIREQWGIDVEEREDD